MNAAGFTSADRRIFSAACSALGGPCAEKLQERLSQGVYDAVDGEVSADLERLAASLRPDRIEKAGRLEIADLERHLPARSHGLIGESSPRGARLDREILVSLQTALWSSRPDRGEWLTRAGLHRLARAAADMGDTGLSVLSALVGEKRRACFIAAQRRLGALESARKQAAAIRRELLTME